jgi:hypothetical protein
MGWNEPDPNSALVLLPPKGKEPGQLSGRKVIPIAVNYVEAKLVLPPGGFFQYDVDIDLSKASKEAKKSRRKNAGAQPGAGTGEPDGHEDAPKPKLWTKLMKRALGRLEAEHRRLTNGQEIKIASDYSKALYSVRDIAMISPEDPEYSFDIDITEVEGNDNNPEVYQVVVKLSAIIETTGAQECMRNIRDVIAKGGEVPSNLVDIERVFNVALKTTPSQNFTAVGHASFFPTPEGDGYKLGGGIVNWTGFSLIYTLGWKSFINIDVANSAFILGQDVVQVLDELFTTGNRRGADPRNVRTWSQDDFKKANELLLNVSIVYPNKAAKDAGFKIPLNSHNHVMNRKVRMLADHPASENTFNVTEGSTVIRTTNVEEYFWETYGARLINRDGLCLKVGDKAIVPAEVSTRSVF